jgi:GTP-binding protein YchF
MRIGIIGLPQSGKSTLFQALTKTSHDAAPPPFGKKEVNISSAKVPDARVDWLHTLYPTAKKTYTTIEYLDVAGLEKGSTQRKGFQEQFLGAIRNVDALLCVVRAFQNDAVPHPEGGVNPARDLTIIQEEFLLSDMALLEGRIARVSAEVKKLKSEEKQKELELYQRCFAALEKETPLRELDFSAAEQKMMRGYQFLTAKPILLVLNIGENDLGKEAAIKTDFEKLGAGRNSAVEAVSAELEMEIAQLPESEKAAFQKELGISEPALNKVIRNCYQLLGLISFLTAGEKEVRAWTIHRGTRAQEAAGAIHSDLERGFIRAEVVHFDTLKKWGSFAKCKEQGVLRLEGKEYVVQDGDVITFRFNV